MFKSYFINLSIAFSCERNKRVTENTLAGHALHSVQSGSSLFFPTLPMSYVVASKLKELVKKHGMMSSGDLADALSKHLESAVATACDRAKANGRKTVRPEDL